MTPESVVDDSSVSLLLLLLSLFAFAVLTIAFAPCCAQLLGAPPQQRRQQQQQQQQQLANANNAIQISNRAHDVTLVPVYSTTPPQQVVVSQRQQPPPNNNNNMNMNMNSNSEIVMSAYGPQERLQAGVTATDQGQQQSSVREVEGEAYQVLQKRPPSQFVNGGRPLTPGQQLFGGAGAPNNNHVAPVPAGGAMQTSRELPPLPADEDPRNYTVVPPVQQMNDAAVLKERLRQKLARVNADLANNSPSDETLNMYNNFPRPPPARDETPAEYRLQRPAAKGPRTPRESDDEAEQAPEEAAGEYTDVRAKPRAVVAPVKQQKASSSSSSSARSGASKHGHGRSKPSF